MKWEEFDKENHDAIIKALDGMYAGLSTMQEMIADKDKRLFSSAIISRLEEMKMLTKFMKEKQLG